jgi:hypothetical protein
LELIERDPKQAREWHYGVDKNDIAIGSSEPILWKRLALHLACAFGAPLGLIETLHKMYPDAINSTDPHNGSLPLHLCCQFGADVSVSRLLVQAHSSSTRAVDAKGRLALHYAVLAAAPFVVVELLVRHDPASVLCPDQDGKTSLQYAHHIYPLDSHVMGLMEMVWI